MLILNLIHTQVKISLTHSTLQHSFNIFVTLLTVALQILHTRSCSAVVVEQTYRSDCQCHLQVCFKVA